MPDWTADTAEWYAARYGDYPTNRLAVEALKLTPAMTIVDVGCGTGAALRHAAARVTEGTLIGVDPVPRMLELARGQTASHPAAGRIEFREGAAEDLPVEDATADVVLAFDSFDHWRDQGRGLAEIRRVLRPQGRLAVVKDGGLPGGHEARRTFLAELAGAGFELLGEQTLDQDGVAFTMWLCARGN